MPWFTKKRKKKASFSFSGHIQGRFRPFPACFGRIGCRPIWPDMADTARFWPNQIGSARIEADSARIEPHWRESSWVGMNSRKKKKKRRRGPMRGQPRRTPCPALDTGAAPLVLRSCFLVHNWDSKLCIVYSFSFPRLKPLLW